MLKTTGILTKRHVNLVLGQPFVYEHVCGEKAKGQILKYVDFVIRGTNGFSFSGGSTSGTTTGENPGGVIDSIEFDAEPSGKTWQNKPGAYTGGKIVKASPRTFIRRRMLEEGSLMYDLNLGSTGVAGAATNYTPLMPIRVKFSNEMNAIPDETAIRLDQFDSFRSTINLTSAITNMLKNNDRTLSITSLAIDIYEYREFAPDFWPGATPFLTDTPISITRAEAEFAIDSQFPAGHLYRDVLFISESTDKALVDTIINKVTLYTGSEQLRSLYEDGIKANQMQYIKDQAASLTGIYYIPIAEGGRSTNAQGNISAVLDVSNPGTDRLIVSSRRFVPRLKVA